MKTKQKLFKIGFISISMIAVFMFSSCEDDKDEDKKLTINNVVAENHDGGTEIPIGGTISVDFEVEAGEAKLDYYHIEIHDHPASGKVEDENNR